MPAPTVRLKIRVRLPNGSRGYLDPAYSPNGKLKPLCAVVHGKVVYHPEGVYNLRYLKGGTRVWQPVGMIDCLVSRAASRALSLAELTIQMKLVGGCMQSGAIRSALASIDRRFLLKLLQLELAARPPQAGVLSLTLTAEPGQSSKVQLGLFAPQTPLSCTAEHWQLLTPLFRRIQYIPGRLPWQLPRHAPVDRARRSSGGVTNRLIG